MAHNKNIKAVLHTDGVIQDFIPRFIDLGFDMLHPIEGCNGQQDIYEIKETYGDSIALHGNIDVSELLAFRTQEEVVKDVREHIDTLRHHGGYIVGSSHDIHEKVNVDNFTAMIETIILYE
jgi:uroporphyrinogen-III decarboxylase